MAAPPVSPLYAPKVQVSLPVALHRFVPDALGAGSIMNETANPNAAETARSLKTADANVAGAENTTSAKPEKALPSTDGYDISWPQCNDKEPAENFNFAIIGVNGGKAMTTNDCFQRQWDWANRGNVQAQVYINVNGLPDNYVDWGCPAGETNCFAYGYGRASAQQALDYARSHGADPKTWWLDVETMNYWSPNLLNNAFVVRGAIEALRDNGKDVGLYSTPYQWSVIAGQYAPNLPVWTAGADDRADAVSRCTNKYAFGGGEVKLVQYIFANFDTNFAC
jgi:hypothetical protein